MGRYDLAFNGESLSSGSVFTKIAPQFVGYVIPRKAIAVEVGPRNLPPVEIVLHRGASVVGRVKGDGSLPLKDALIWMIDSYVTTRLKPDGSFRWEGVPTGETKRLSINPLEALRYVYRIHVDVEASMLKPGATVDVGEVKFSPLAGETNVRGVFKDSAGRPMTGIRWSAVRHTTKPISGILLVREGKCEGELPPGTYEICLHSFDWEEKPFDTVTVEPGKVTQIDIQVPPDPMIQPAPAPKKPG